MDDSIPASERSLRFSKWVSGYYNHKSLTSRNIDDLQHLLGPDSPPSTLDTLSPEDEAEITCYPAIARHEVTARSGKPEVYRERLRRVICEESLLKYFPICCIDVVWCENTTWSNVNSSWIVEKMVENADEAKIKRRQFRNVMIPGPKANHFVSKLLQMANKYS